MQLKEYWRRLRPQIARVRRILLGRYLWATRIAVASIFLLLIGTALFSAYSYFKATQLGYYTSLAQLFLFPDDTKIKAIDGRTNILILGKGGEQHTASDLTDTMIFASIAHQEPYQIDLVSLPRDLWIAPLRAKLNSVYYWGNEKQPGGGLTLAKSTVEEIVGQPIHYAVVFDFEGFVEIVDLLGGITVEVEKGFTDENYPIAGKENDLCDGDRQYRCRYETLTFESGVQEMNGDRALKYVRSRQSTDLEEGTDIARSRRQRQVIQAVVKKLASKEVVTSPNTLKQLLESVDRFTETDLSDEAMAILARRAYQGKDALESHSIPEELLVNPPIQSRYDNLYVFIPVLETAFGEPQNWSQIQEWLANTL